MNKCSHFVHSMYFRCPRYYEKNDEHHHCMSCGVIIGNVMNNITFKTKFHDTRQECHKLTDHLQIKYIDYPKNIWS